MLPEENEKLATGSVPVLFPVNVDFLLNVPVSIVLLVNVCVSDVPTTEPVIP